MNYTEAISDTIVAAMERDPKIVLLGSGAPDRTGVFGTTKEATRRFPDRVYDVPNSEAALGGVVCGLASQGYHPLWHHHRVDFATYGFDPIVNLLAKWQAMYQTDPLPVTIRAIVGRGWGQGPTHSQFLGSTFAHFPGIEVLVPDSASAARDLLGSALWQPRPCLVLEHRALYLYEEHLWAPFPARTPPVCTVVSCSTGVAVAYAARRRLNADYHIAVDVRAVRVLSPPYNFQPSLARTGRLVVLDPGWAGFGFSAEICAVAAESGLLKAPPVRVAPPAVPAPTSAPLEHAYWPGADAVVQAVLRLLGREETTSGMSTPNTFKGPY